MYQVRKHKKRKSERKKKETRLQKKIRRIRERRKRKKKPLIPTSRGALGRYSTGYMSFLWIVAIFILFDKLI
jgi:hypothetical protein